MRDSVILILNYMVFHTTKELKFGIRHCQIMKRKEKNMQKRQFIKCIYRFIQFVSIY